MNFFFAWLVCLSTASFFGVKYTAVNPVVSPVCNRPRSVKLSHLGTNPYSGPGRCHFRNNDENDN